MNQDEPESGKKDGIKEHISGLGQKIIGGIEEVGGALTGDPLTQAEGIFNAEVGEIRDELEESGIEDESDQ